MAAPIDVFRVEFGRDTFSLFCITLPDRRAAGHPLLKFCFQRQLEHVLYGRSDGSSGPIWKLMNSTGLGSSALQVNKAAVAGRILAQAEFDLIMETFKRSLPSDLVDPCSLGRVRVPSTRCPHLLVERSHAPLPHPHPAPQIRMCTILPVATAAALARTFGRSEGSTAFLRAFSQPVPESWELHAQAEELRANLRVDLVLEDQIAELDFEAEELTIAEELTQAVTFKDNPEDTLSLRSYALTPTRSLRNQLAAYVAHRTRTFAARRAGGAVVSASAEHDTQALLRFLGWVEKTNRTPQGVDLDILFLTRGDMGTLAESFAGWLESSRRVRFTTIANTLSGLVSLMNYVYNELVVEQEVLELSPNPIEQIVNLRDQATGAIKQQNLFEPNNIQGGYITWDQVQQTRVNALTHLDALPPTATANQRRVALMQATMISFLSMLPPDRVGVVRKLRLKHTLVRREEGGWRISLTKRGEHKTSKHYGPFVAKLPSELDGVIERYASLLELEPGSDEGAYLFGSNGAIDRPFEMSGFTQAVRRAFKKHSPNKQEISPKVLRSSFITWLRDSTDCPSILKAAAAAQKHSEQRQGSDSYDAERDTRLVKAAVISSLPL